MAITHRPDLRAYRLGLDRAQLDRLKALIEPLNQITVYRLPDGLALPGRTETGRGCARPPGVGSLVTLPMVVLNQGALQRAAINVEQTRTELANIEHKVILGGPPSAVGL